MTRFYFSYVADFTTLTKTDLNGSVYVYSSALMPFFFLEGWVILFEQMEKEMLVSQDKHIRNKGTVY